MKKLIGLLVVVAFNQNASALPGFVDLLKANRPQMAPKCTTCHNAGTGRPTNNNVTTEGHTLYEVLKEEAKKFNLVHLSRRKIENPDLIVFGDTRTNNQVHTDIVQNICAENSGMVLHTGDIVASGSNAGQWQTALKIEKCLVDTKLLHPSCGNHEGGYCTKNVLRDALGNHDSYYSFEYKGFTFLALNSQDQSNEQISWLSKLPAGKKYIPFFHHAPYPTIAGHGADGGLLKRFVPEFKRLGVKISFNGHNHGYDRAMVNDTQYVTIGGGGAPLYPCGPKKSYTESCLSDYGYVRCKIPRAGVFECQAVNKAGEEVDFFSVDYL